MVGKPYLEITSRSPVLGEVMSGRSNDLDAGILGEVGASKVTGGIGVVDGEDAGVEGEGGEVGEGGAVGGAAQGGDVAEVMSELPIPKFKDKK